ncbi:MAG: metal ABC transporter solute-binding protein, Zn/Mn family [Dehalococcoidia bacterium]
MKFTRLLLILRRNKEARLGVAILLMAASFACSGNKASGSSGAAGPMPAPDAIKVVAVENFYGDIVHQLGGSHVDVTIIISDPNADPHEYESSSDNAKAIAAAKLVVENGVGYDTFIDKLLAASPNQGRAVINAGALLGKKEGDNPHVWYSVAAVAQIADRITSALEQIDAANQTEFASRNGDFKSTLQPISNKISAMKATYGGSHLTQTEPVFGYMGDDLGLKIDDGEYQHAVEEGTDPSPQSVAAINRELTNHEVKALLYNSQTSTPATKKLRDLATQKKVPIVGVSELEPKGKTYQQWMLSQLDTLQKALGG